MRDNLKRWCFAVLCLVSIASMGQTEETFTIPLSSPGEEGKLVVHIVDGSINVMGYGGDEVVVEASGRQRNRHWNNKRTEKKKSEMSRNGMKRMVENSLEFSVEENNNKVYVKYQPGKWVIDFTIKVPRNFSVDLRTVNKGDIMVESVNGTHEVSNTNGKVTMRGVGGSVIADALNKDIVITFESIHNGTNMMFSSLNGDVDVSFPKNFKANVLARSDNGSVYTDFEMEKIENGNNIKTSNKNGVYRVKREKGISGAINGGGAEVTFKTLNGDILIREN